jgi:5-methylcytosine-specific restriction endonuclease McrA
MTSDRTMTLRERIIARDEYRCVYCGESFPGEALTLDHVEPRMRGGDQSPGNLVSACRDCNKRKGSAPAWAFLAVNPAELANFRSHARHVWPRLMRAIDEEAAKHEPLG